MLIGLTAPKATGKTTFANVLLAIASLHGGHGGERRSLAAGLRRAAKAFFAFTADQAAAFDDPARKEQPLEPWASHYGPGFTPRHILQVLGTECFRQQFDADIHIQRERLWLANAHPRALIIYDDIRYDNEASFIRSEGGIIVHLRRPNRSASHDTHISERGVELHPADHVITDRSGSGWHQEAKSLLQHLSTKAIA